MTATHHLAAVVVTHNRLPQLRMAVAALLAEPLDRLIVVDNDSDDGTRPWLAGIEDSRLRVLTMATNVGGAGGFEAGLASILSEGLADWMLLLDDDARPLPGAISTFRAIAGKLTEVGPGTAPVGVIAAAVVNAEGRMVEMNRPSLNPFWRPALMVRTLLGRGRRGTFHLPEAAFAPDAAPCEVDAASFVGFFVRRAAVERVGLPDGGLFLYSDDVLYSFAIRRAGFRILFAPRIRFRHDCASLDRSRALRPLWKVYYLCRNNVTMVRQAAGPLMFPLALGWYVLAWWRKARLYPPEERAVYRSLMRAGLRDGLAGRRGRLGAAVRPAKAQEAPRPLAERPTRPHQAEAG